MAKINIEEALKIKLPLPWKKKNLDGSVTWEILRQRPESMTTSMYCDLRTYGLKDAEIRELFYVMPADWATLKNRLGIDYAKSSKSNNTVSKRELGASRLASIAANKLPKVEVSTEPTLPETKSTNQESVDIHQPTRQEVETFFGVDDNPSIDLSGWETFDLSKIPNRQRSLIAGTKKLYVGVGVKFIKDWERCCVKVRPDGKQLALEKTTGTGYKVGRDHQRPAITCRQATEKLTSIVGAGAEFIPIIEQENLLVFEHKGAE